jgi:histone acetyltransferase (RNA polymerase elongator complex component)
MEKVDKKLQIIKEYFKELTPYIKTEVIDSANLRFECSFKVPRFETKKSYSDEKFILDFSDYSVKEVFIELQTLDKKIWY